MNRFTALVALALSGVGLVNAATDEYPLRVRYPDAPIISTQELTARIDAVTVIDVRSKYEFDTLHVKGAVNVPLSKSGFGEAIARLREKDKKPFVFYCNGKTCHKSYDAVLLAVRARVNDVFTYDAGIMDWAKAHPDRTVLLGHSPIQPGELIDAEKFKAHLLEPKDFATRVDGNVIILDVRDRVQRDSPLFPFKERRAELGEIKKLDAAIEDAKQHKKTLLVYDAVGKQVEWFQYHLESRGLKDYYFMKGGSQKYFDDTLGKVVLGGEGATKLAK
jgi:rhodanese-related sulfurtransferase